MLAHEVADERICGVESMSLDLPDLLAGVALRWLCLDDRPLIGDGFSLGGEDRPSEQCFGPARGESPLAAVRAA